MPKKGAFGECKVGGLMTLWRIDEHGLGTITVQPFEGDDFRTVEVYIGLALDRVIFGGLARSPAKVNWPSIGARTPKEARLFARALVVAAGIAEKINRGIEKEMKS